MAKVTSAADRSKKNARAKVTKSAGRFKRSQASTAKVTRGNNPSPSGTAKVTTSRTWADRAQPSTAKVTRGNKAQRARAQGKGKVTTQRGPSVASKIQQAMSRGVQAVAQKARDVTSTAKVTSDANRSTRRSAPVTSGAGRFKRSQASKAKVTRGNNPSPAGTAKVTYGGIPPATQNAKVTKGGKGQRAKVAGSAAGRVTGVASKAAKAIRFGAPVTGALMGAALAGAILESRGRGGAAKMSLMGGDASSTAKPEAKKAATAPTKRGPSPQKRAEYSKQEKIARAKNTLRRTPPNTAASFDDAFRDARRAKVKTFTWRGKKYTTEMK